MIKAIIRLGKRLFQTGITGRLKAKFLTEVPDALNDATIYVVGENGYHWFAVMLCPCGCKQRVHLNLVQSASPKWRFHRHPNGALSFSPSIARSKGCKSHFFIKESKIVWCTKQN